MPDDSQPHRAPPTFSTTPTSMAVSLMENRNRAKSVKFIMLCGFTVLEASCSITTYNSIAIIREFVDERNMLDGWKIFPVFISIQAIAVPRSWYNLRFPPAFSMVDPFEHLNPKDDCFEHDLCPAPVRCVPLHRATRTPRSKPVRRTSLLGTVLVKRINGANLAKPCAFLLHKLTVRQCYANQSGIIRVAPPLNSCSLPAHCW